MEYVNKDLARLSASVRPTMSGKTAPEVSESASSLSFIEKNFDFRCAIDITLNLLLLVAVWIEVAMVLYANGIPVDWEKQNKSEAVLSAVACNKVNDNNANKTSRAGGINYCLFK